MTATRGPHGTLYVLRLCGFPEGAADARGATELERTVFGARTFFRCAGPGGRPDRGRAHHQGGVDVLLVVGSPCEVCAPSAGDVVDRVPGKS